MCQQYMKVAVVIRTHAEAMEFANFMAWQCQWDFRAPFKVDAIWFQHEAFKTEMDASVVLYIMEKCPNVMDVAVSETVYVTLVGCTMMDTGKVSKLTILGDSGLRTHHSLVQRYHALHQPHVFQRVTSLVLYNSYSLRSLHLDRHPSLTSVAICRYGRAPDTEETSWIMSHIRGAVHLESFVIIYYKAFNSAFARWVKESRRLERRIYIVESTTATERIQNDSSWWRADAVGDRSIWDRARDCTAAAEDKSE
jgi:hypothetical protein